MRLAIILLALADIRRMRAAGELFRCHSFELACAKLDIEHRLTKPNHPSTSPFHLSPVNPALTVR